MKKGFHLNYKVKRSILIGFSILLLISIYFFKDASYILRAFSTIGTMAFFYAVDHIYNVKFRKRHYAFIFVITILSFMASPIYYIYPHYDKVQHFVQPIMLCSLIFFMINKLTLELKWKLAFSFFTVVAILGLFEIGEFALDSFFDIKAQGVYLRDVRGIDKFNLIMDPLKDTMFDLILGVIGTGMYCVLFAYVMRRRLHHHIFREV